MSDDLPEPMVPLRNMGEILDKEIPIRVRIEFDEYFSLRLEERNRRLKKMLIIGAQVIPAIVSIIIIYYR